MKQPIYYRYQPGAAWQCWADRVGTANEIRRSAAGLCVSLADEAGATRPAVRIGERGKTISLRTARRWLKGEGK